MQHITTKHNTMQQETFEGENFRELVRGTISWRKLSQSAKTYHRWVWHTHILWRKRSRVALNRKIRENFPLYGIIVVWCPSVKEDRIERCLGDLCEHAGP